MAYTYHFNQLNNYELDNVYEYHKGQEVVGIRAGKVSIKGTFTGYQRGFGFAVNDIFGTEYCEVIKIGEELPVVIKNTHYPHVCTNCGGNAYIGAYQIDCTGVFCKFNTKGESK